MYRGRNIILHTWNIMKPMLPQHFLNGYSRKMKNEPPPQKKGQIVTVPFSEWKLSSGKKKKVRILLLLPLWMVILIPWGPSRIQKAVNWSQILGPCKSDSWSYASLLCILQKVKQLVRVLSLQAKRPSLCWK